MGKQSIKLKICGMRDPDNILEVATVRPDFMGFIFYNKSPRYVGDDFKIPDDFPDSILRVGVFVNEETREMTRLAKKHKLDYLQLHGAESVLQVKTLRATGFKLIKVFSIGVDFDFSNTYEYQPYCDYFLFDTKGKYYGGNAATFDWKLLEKYDQQVPFFLSGGINIENVRQVTELKDMNLFALDVNSGVEVSPGVKSVESIIRLTAQSGLTDMDII